MYPLHNAVTVCHQRIGKRVAQLSAARMNGVGVVLASLWVAIRIRYGERPVRPRIFPMTRLKHAHSVVSPDGIVGKGYHLNPS
jgi:hypothetical protein